MRQAVTIDATVDVVHCYLPETLTDFGFSTLHELDSASAILLENEVSTALAAMPTAPQVYRSSTPGRPTEVLLARAG